MSFAPGVSLGPLITIATVVLIDSWDPASTPTIRVVNVSAYVPKGAKGVEVSIITTGSTAGRVVAVRKHDSTTDDWDVRVQVANIHNAGTGPAVVNASGEFDVWSEHLDIAAVYVKLIGYYMGG